MAVLAAVVLVAGVLLGERRRRRGEADTLILLGATPLARHLPAGSLAALAAVLGSTLGLPLGTRAAGNLLGAPAGWPTAGHEMLLAVFALTLIGLVLGWLSVPRASEPAA